MKIRKRKTPKSLRIVLYLRKSSLKKVQEPSIPQQRRAGHGWAKRIGAQVVGEYVDAGISGVRSADARPGFQALLKAAGNDEFDVVWVWEVSRLSRSDFFETCAEIKPLYDARVRVAIAETRTPLDWRKIEDLIKLLFDSNAASESSKSMSKGVGRGHHELARVGKWVSGRPSIGFRVDKKTRKLKRGPANEVRMVKWIFDAYERGESLRTIMREMVARGFKSNQMTVRRILSNILYTGDWIWPRTCQAKLYRMVLVGDDAALPERIDENTEMEQPDGNWRRSYTVERENQYFIKANHVAIIDRDQFDRVQKLLASTRRKTNTTPNVETRAKLAFSNQLLKCGKCGATMSGCVVPKKNGNRVDVIAYECNTNRRSDCCDANRVPQGRLMDLVCDTLENLYCDDETRRRLKDAAAAELKQASKSTDAAGLKKQIAKAEKELLRLEKKWLNVDEDTDAGKRQARLLSDAQATQQSKIEKARAALATVSKNLPDVLNSIDERATRASGVIGQLRSLQHQPQAFRNLLLTLVDHIVVTTQKHGGRWKITNGEIVLRYDADDFSSYLSPLGTRPLQASDRDSGGIFVPLLIAA